MHCFCVIRKLKTSNIYHVFNNPFRPVLIELHASVMTYRSCQKITHKILFINDHGLYICYKNVYIITLPLCVILRLENVILPRDFCYRNGHALALINDVSWSKIKKRVTPTVMIYQPPKNAQNITHLIRPNSYRPR